MSAKKRYDANPPKSDSAKNRGIMLACPNPRNEIEYSGDTRGV